MLNKILFIGLGGAGQRHLRLFKKNLQDKKVEFIAYRTIKKTPLLNTDFTVNEKTTVEKQYEVKCYVSLKEALATKPDLAVISTPSSMHLKYAQLCAEHGINLFIEKPLSHSTFGLEKLKQTLWATLKARSPTARPEPEPEAWETIMIDDERPRRREPNLKSESGHGPGAARAHEDAPRAVGMGEKIRMSSLSDVSAPLLLAS